MRTTWEEEPLVGRRQEGAKDNNNNGAITAGASSWRSFFIFHLAQPQRTGGNHQVPMLFISFQFSHNHQEVRHKVVSHLIIQPVGSRPHQPFQQVIISLALPQRTGGSHQVVPLTIYLLLC